MSQQAEANAVSPCDEHGQKVMDGQTIEPVICGEKHIITMLREAAVLIKQEISKSGSEHSRSDAGSNKYEGSYAECSDSF